MELKNTFHNEKTRQNAIEIFKNTIPLLFSSGVDSNNNLFITEVKTTRGKHIKNSFFIEASYITGGFINTCRIPIMQANLIYEHTTLGNKTCYAKIDNFKNLSNKDVDINVITAIIKHAETFSAAALSEELNILSTTDNHAGEYTDLLPDHFLEELGYTKNSSKYIPSFEPLVNYFVMTKKLPINNKIKDDFKIFEQ